MEQNSSRRNLLLAVLAFALIAGAILVIVFTKKRAEVSPKGGAVQTAKEASESVPEIQTNPGQKVPEINPLDRANPFKYTNPLR